MKFLSIVLFSFCFLTSQAQQKKLDSLLAVNENYPKEDSIKARHLTNIFRQYARMSNYEKVEEYSAKAIAIAKKLPRTYSLTYIYERLGLCYHGASRYAQAIDYYTKGIEVSRQRNDKAQMAVMYLDLGALYSSFPDYVKSLEANQIAINLYNEVGDTNEISSCYMNVGVLYSKLRQPTKAIEYMQKAMVVFKTQNAGLNYGVSLAYESMANAYLDASNDELVTMGINPKSRNLLAIELFDNALKVAETLKENSLIGSINDDIGRMYERAGNNSLALEHYLKALESFKKERDQDNLSNMYASLGKYYVNNNDLNKGLTYLNQGLQLGKQFGILSVQETALEKISYIYEKAGHFDTAFLLYKQYIVIKDSIFNKEKEKETTRKQLQIDFAIKENDYKLTQQISDSKLKHQMLLATQQQQQLAIKQQQLQLISKEKDVQRLTYLKKQAELQNEQQLQAALLQKNTAQSKYEKGVSDKQIAEQQLQISFDKKVKIFLAIAIGMLVAIAFLIYYNQRKTTKLNKIISKQKIELEQLGNVKDRIFSVVSHDMRAPVNALIGFIQLLENNHISPEKLHLYANELKNHLTHTSNLMENLLNWAASQMQGFNPQIKQLQVHDILDDLVKSLEPQAARKGIIIHNNIAAASMAYADKDMFALVIRNLLSNAIKYSFKNGTVELNAREENGQITFSVKDNGGGITNEKLLHINASKAMSIESSMGTENEKGTGLGLMLCKTFASLMNGQIIAKSEPQKGSEFLLTLPNC